MLQNLINFFLFNFVLEIIMRLTKEDLFFIQYPIPFPLSDLNFLQVGHKYKQMNLF